MVFFLGRNLTRTGNDVVEDGFERREVAALNAFEKLGHLPNFYVAQLFVDAVEVRATSLPEIDLNLGGRKLLID